MFEVAFIMLLGVACGWVTRRWRMKWLGKLSLVIICLLLLVLGVEVGFSRDGIESVGSTLVAAFVLALFALVGSVLLTHLLHQNKKDER